MSEDPDQEYQSFVVPVPAKKSFWQKFGAGSLTISILFHGALLVAGGFWIFSVVQPPEPVVDFMPKSGGGGSPASDSKQKQHRVQMMQPNMARIAAVGATSNMVLPEPDAVSQMTSLGSMSSGGLGGGGLGGSGSGGGRGDGNGMGTGSGMAPGLSTGAGSKNPFGMTTLEIPALTGTFYDFKQTRSGQATELSVDDVVTILNDFTNRGWRESSFNKYFKAKQLLYQTKLYIPMMPADNAPAAFNCADQVKPSRWAIVYRGMVTPPRTGKYRFVGSGDDVLVVRFNNKNVFDHGYFSGTTQVRIHQKMGALTGKTEDADVKKMTRRDYPMEMPLKVYPYPTTGNYNGSVGGLGVGPVFEAEQGKNYPIDILLSELPGGLFCGALLIEEVGVDYEKASSGSPILPLFRFDNGVPEPTNADNAPPYDPKGPVWKVVAGKGKAEI